MMGYFFVCELYKNKARVLHTYTRKFGFAEKHLGIKYILQMKNDEIIWVQH